MAERVAVRITGQTTQWDYHPSDFIDEINADVTKLTIELAYSIWDGLIARSPVWSGRYRASWYMGLRQKEFYAQGGSPESPLPEPVRPVLKSRATKQPPKIWITNGSPYFDRIEEGWSGQAPAGVVRVTLESVA